MPLGLRKFRIGGVEFPLKAETGEILKDADPAIFYSLQLFETTISEYVGERLLAEAALEKYRFPSAVAKTIHYEPMPFLQAHDMVFPLFALYRSEEIWEHHTTTFEKANAVWIWNYIFPPLEPSAIERLDPILQCVAKIVGITAMQSYDPNWEAGKTLRDLSGIQKMQAGPTKFLDIEMVDGGQAKWWRGVSGRIFVQERTEMVLSDLDPYEGANVKVDLASATEPKVEAFFEANTQLAPTLERVEPAAGTKAGGAYFEIVGRGFRPGTPIKILIGGSYASSARVLSSFKASGLTPEHSAYPTFAADVQVIDADEQASNVLPGAYLFTTP